MSALPAGWNFAGPTTPAYPSAAPAAAGGAITGAETAGGLSGLFTSGLNGIFGVAEAAVPAFIQAKLNQQKSPLNTAQPTSINSIGGLFTGTWIALGAGALLLVVLLTRK